MAPGDTGRTRHALSVSVTDGRGRALRGSLARWLSKVAPASARGTVTIALVTDARMRALNGQFRRKDYATDVLSFPVGRDQARVSRIQVRLKRDATATRGLASFVQSQAHLGDIVIAKGVARRQAREAGHAEDTEHRVLALHGLLHLLGYDHEHDTGQMARVERRLRRKGGLREGLIERP